MQHQDSCTATDAFYFRDSILTASSFADAFNSISVGFYLLAAGSILEAMRHTKVASDGTEGYTESRSITKTYRYIVSQLIQFAANGYS